MYLYLSQRRPDVAKKLRILAVLALAGGLLAAAPSAFAQVEPGNGWKSYSPGFKLQQFGCGKINDLTFTLSCANKSGQQRAERRDGTQRRGNRPVQGPVPDPHQG